MYLFWFLECLADVQPELPENRFIRVENKNFYFDIGNNYRGIFMRVSEVQVSLSLTGACGLPPGALVHYQTSGCVQITWLQLKITHNSMGTLGGCCCRRVCYFRLWLSDLDLAFDSCKMKAKPTHTEPNSST